MNDYKINAKSVKEQASGKWLEILPLLDARLADAVARAGKHVPCPIHGGKDGFRLKCVLLSRRLELITAKSRH